MVLCMACAYAPSVCGAGPAFALDLCALRLVVGYIPQGAARDPLFRLGETCWFQRCMWLEGLTRNQADGN